MVLIYIVILAGIFEAIGQYLDKHLVNIGISKKEIILLYVFIYDTICYNNGNYRILYKPVKI